MKRFIGRLFDKPPVDCSEAEFSGQIVSRESFEAAQGEGAPHTKDTQALSEVPARNPILADSIADNFNRKMREVFDLDKMEKRVLAAVPFLQEMSEAQITSALNLGHIDLDLLNYICTETSLRAHLPKYSWIEFPLLSPEELESLSNKLLRARNASKIQKSGF